MFVNDASEQPLLGSPSLSDSDLESLSSPDLGRYGRKRSGGRLNWRRLRPSFRLIAIGAISISFFLFGFIVHGPSLPRVTIKLQRPPAPGQVPPRLHDAVRVRVLHDLMLERYQKTDSTGARDENWPALERLASCLEMGTCMENEKQVVLLASYHFGFAEDGGTGGEDLWARSTIAALRELNYTIIFTWGHMDTLMVYQHIPDMVPAILMEQGEFHHCMARNDETYKEIGELEPNAPGDWQKGKHGCFQTQDFPTGLPWWKTFMFLFWEGHEHPLGGQFVMAPEDYNKLSWSTERHYLGYSIEPRCTQSPTFEKREHRALILAKEPKYFEHENRMYGLLGAARDSVPPAIVDGQEIKFDFVITAGEAGEIMPEPNTTLVSLGRMEQKKWREALARSKAMVGIGHPELSPSPYDALCLGVPFINPIKEWDTEDPNNRTAWRTQQDGLKFLDPPYVYHVHEGDGEGLKTALQQAVATQIDRFILPNMHMSNIKERITEWLNTDWQSRAKEYVHRTYGDDHTKLHLIMKQPPLETFGFGYT